MITRPLYLFLFAWFTVAWVLVVNAALAQEEPAEPDPDSAAKIDASPRNPDMIQAKINASSRAQNAHHQAAPQATAAPSSSQRDQDMRMLAARGIGPTINVCSVVQIGRGAAQAPVIQNSSIDINCVPPGVVVGR